MKTTILPGTDLLVSRFIFGTASLLNIGGAKRRRAHLEAAADAGFTHFDTAPYYGFGMAERDLKSALAGRPHLTITSKVGLYPPGGANRSSTAILTRKLGGRVFPALSRPTVDWSVERARASLDESLRRLGRDRIDAFMLHEPRHDILNTDEWLRWLETETQTGRVRHFGLALDARALPPFLDESSPLCRIVQINDSMDEKEADILVRHGRPIQITYGYISSIKRRGEAFDATRVLSSALKRNSTGAIVVATGRSDRLGQYAALTEDGHAP